MKKSALEKKCRGFGHQDIGILNGHYHVLNKGFEFQITYCIPFPFHVFNVSITSATLTLQECLEEIVPYS
jgi:hypothetical protein